MRDNQTRIGSTLRLYALYRAAFTLLFLLLLLSTRSRELFPPLHSALYAVGASTFAAGSLLVIAHGLWRRFAIRPLALLIHFALDIAAIGTITFAAGGLSSGFALPLIITTACAAAVLQTRFLLLLTALASLTLLAQESMLALRGSDHNLFAAGLLGALLFAIALGIRQLSEYLRDVERQQAVQASETARLEKLNELIIRRMHTGLVVVDQQGTIVLINRAAIDLLGGNRPQRPLAARQTLNVLPELYRLHQRWRIYPWLRLPTFMVGGNEIQPSFAALDPEEKRHTLIFLEDNSTHAQRAQQLKLASLGKLTAGIAHEIRNPLGAVSHAAQLLCEQLSSARLPDHQAPDHQAPDHQAPDHQEPNHQEPDHQEPNLQAPGHQAPGHQAPGNANAPGAHAARLAEIIVTHTGRINDIVENVLQLSRQRPAEGSRFELRAWLREFASEYSDQPGRETELEFASDNAPVTIEFDPSQLSQVLTNLLDNALYHSHARTGARWASLRTGVDAVSGRPWLDVCDRGAGVSAAERERLFEPFFTNSPQGTGLGLYISRELCEMNRATLECRPPEPQATGESLPGGACFRIGFAHPERYIEPPQR